MLHIQKNGKKKVKVKKLRPYMVNVKNVLVRRQSEMKSGGCCNFQEAFRLQEKRKDGHEGSAVPSWDVHRVGRAANEAIGLSCERGKTIAMRLGHLLKSRHANGQSDMRRPVEGAHVRKKSGSRYREQEETVSVPPPARYV
jgi:hypothetical protein